MLSPDGRFFALGDSSLFCGASRSTCITGPVEVWSIASDRRVAAFNDVSAAAWSPDGTRLAVWVSFFKHPKMLGVRVYDTRTWKLVSAVDGAFSGASFSADGKLIVSLRYAVSRTKPRRSKRPYVGPPPDPYSITPTGAVVWNAADGHVVTTVHDSSIDDAVFAPAGDLVVATRSEKPPSVWHGRTGAAVAELTRTDVGGPAFSRDGSLLALGSESRTDVWDVGSWKLLASVRESFADFSMDDRFVMTETQDGGVQVWEAESGEHLLTLTRPALLQGPVFGSDSRSIVGVGDDGVVRTVPCPTCVPVDDLLAAAQHGIATRP